MCSAITASFLWLLSVLLVLVKIYYYKHSYASAVVPPFVPMLRIFRNRGQKSFKVLYLPITNIRKLHFVICLLLCIKLLAVTRVVGNHS